MNWAVQHPLKGLDGGTSYTYHEWGTPRGELLHLFAEYFGEASLRYPLHGIAAPREEEVREIVALYKRTFAVDL